MRKQFARSLLFMAVVATGISVIPSGCKSKTEQKKDPPALKVLETRGKEIPEFLEMVGQAVGIPTVNITARVEGYLRNWSFEEGSIVNKGRLLFTIEQDKYINNVNYSQADFESKTAAWEKAQLDVARLKPLLATNAISQNDYDVAVTTEKQTRAAVESSRSNLADAKLNLSYTTITSPITGFIGKVNVNPGNLVGHGDATLLTTVSAINPIYIDFQMSETDYLSIMRYIAENKENLQTEEPSLKVYLTLSDKRMFPYPGKIDFVDRAINPQTGTIAMRAEVPNPDGLLRPGSFATVNLILMERKNTVVIPQSATTQIQGKNFVFLLDGGNKVSRVPVVLGRTLQNLVVVNKGLQPGDKILLEGFQKFQEGMIIRPVVVPDTARLPELFK